MAKHGGTPHFSPKFFFQNMTFWRPDPRPRLILNLQTSPMMPWDWLTTRGAPDTVNCSPSPLWCWWQHWSLQSSLSIYGSGSRTSISPSCNAATDTDTPLPSLLLTWPVATPCNCNMHRSLLLCRCQCHWRVMRVTSRHVGYWVQAQINNQIMPARRPHLCGHYILA